MTADEFFIISAIIVHLSIIITMIKRTKGVCFSNENPHTFLCAIDIHLELDWNQSSKYPLFWKVLNNTYCVNVCKPIHRIVTLSKTPSNGYS